MLGGIIMPLSNFGEQLGIEPKPDASNAIKFIVSEFTSTQKSMLPLHYCSHVVGGMDLNHNCGTPTRNPCYITPCPVLFDQILQLGQIKKSKKSKGSKNFR